MPFIQKSSISKPTNPVITTEMLKDMKDYQLGLIDYLSYNVNLSKGATGAKIQNHILAEIRSIDFWLKDKWGEIAVNNLRSFNN